jgi:hypothetical protein
MDSKVVSG